MENRKAVIEIDGVKYSVTIHEKVEEKTAKRWRAEKGGDFYALGVDGIVYSFKEIGHKVDDFNYATGNYFKTKEEAKRYLNYILTRQRVKDRIAELNALEDGESNLIEFPRNLDEVGSSYESSCFGEDWKIMKNHNIAYQLKQEFTEQELKLALFEVY